MNSGSGKTDIIEIFTADAGEHLQTINDDLLALEQNKEDLHLVDKIFRDVHAIKGSAGMVGFSVVSQFSHKIEDLLAKIRDHKLNLSESVIDLLFHADRVFPVREHARRRTEKSRVRTKHHG